MPGSVVPTRTPKSQIELLGLAVERADQVVVRLVLVPFKQGSPLE
jgi:hypothetical protein